MSAIDHGRRSSWEYRVIERDGDFGIYEVYYSSLGRIEAFTMEPVAPGGESLEELKRDLRFYRAALSKPVLDYTSLEKTVRGRGCRPVELGTRKHREAVR